MAFRFLLVGAVAALGLDLPQGIDVDAWTQSGRAWWHARVAEFEARHGIALAEIEGAPAPEVEAVVEAEALAEDADAAFATVIEEVVSAFAVDGASGEIEVSGPEQQLVAGVADPSYGPEFADALNRWADGLSEPAEPAPLAAEAGDLPFASDPGTDPIEAPTAGFAGPAVASAVVAEAELLLPSDVFAEAPADAEVFDGGEPAPSGLRFVQAVQLTGQALQAWLALVQPAAPQAL